MSLLEDIIGTKAYEFQKDIFKGIVNNGKKELLKRKDEIYVLQKEVIADIVENVKADLREDLYENYEDFCIYLEAKIPLLGKLIAKILMKYRDRIIEGLL